MDMTKNASQLQDKDFDSKVTNSKGLVLVDFWAEWCGPCKVVGPIIDGIAENLGNQVQVFKMDVDTNPNTPTRFHIRGIPTVILFKDGLPVEQIVGSYPREVFEKSIRSHLS
jgi:thioredoxin 1